MNSLNDIFQLNLFDNIDQVSILDMLVALGLAFALGLFIRIVYKKTFKGVMYSESFGVSLMVLTLISTLIILATTSKIILSLKMVGALSVIRFRTAIKEPLDTAFLFWAISVGVILGGGLIPIALLGSVIIGITMLLFVNRKPNETSYIVVVNCRDDECEDGVLSVINDKVEKYAIKSKTVSRESGFELTVEIRLKEMKTNFINDLYKINGVSNVVMVSYNGDYMG
ncbi:DUF4956 domain-containing protein [Sporanaerobacter acetigenes]|uniref:DUF4956 domain-containing protein n=1 Tax=Sporanaerobacter acetigenes DSM 13106 TaxID=1123281 RepID=A0A1M5WAR7_9FIRM|nr:DUF4956 domain-containing protein [Sporanaerobacter acetigenes]SHH84547.1 protein of unknown function [Sporanaerobacter acetigenes DSM 13106]